jgi:predicted DNA binding CopG/RHH family protein
MKRDNHITIRLSDEELVQIERKANEKCVTRSEYMRIRSMESQQQNLESVHIEL